MKIWVIKNKGAMNWRNFMHSYELTINNKEKIYTQFCFLFKRDAELYMRTNYAEHIEFYEVVGAILPLTKQDNRKKNYGKKTSST